MAEVLNVASDSESGPVVLLSSLQERANLLLVDLIAFQECLAAHHKQKEVEIRNFRRGIESEVKSLDTASQSQRDANSKDSLTEFELEEQESKYLHSLRSSNLPFYETVWAVARQSEGLLALGKRVYWELPSLSPSCGEETFNGTNIRTIKREKRSAVVDIIAKEGLEWIKVSTITEKRLLFEMAKEGWEAYGDSSDSAEEDEDENTIDNTNKQSDATQLELVKLASILRTASRATRVRFKHPNVRFILPKIHEGTYAEIDAVIADIRSLGIQVTCGEPDTNTGSSHNLTALLPFSSLFKSLPTPILNIDCTILLALISDISHVHSSDLPAHPTNISGHYHKAITRQIASELTIPLLPTQLYPYLTAHTLICTAAAAQRMHEIVQTMGTPSEQARAAILLGTSTAQDLRAALQDLSCHTVPRDLHLPIKTVMHGPLPCAETVCSSQETRVIEKVVRTVQLSAINRSVFLYGWCRGLVTVTSNRSIALGLVRSVNEILDEEEADGEEIGRFQGPLMYVCETARSLIGKEKQG